MIRSINLWNKIDPVDSDWMRQYVRKDKSWKIKIYKVDSSWFKSYLHKKNAFMNPTIGDFHACDVEMMLDWAEGRIKEYENETMKYGFLSLTGF